MFTNVFQRYLTPKNVMFLVAAILFIIFILQIKDIAIMFFASFVIACSMDPLVQKLSVKMNRSTASAIVLLSCITAFCLLFIPLIIIGGNEIKSFAASFPAYIDEFKNFISHSSIIHNTDISKLDVSGIISSASGVSTKLIDAGKNLGSGLVYLVISILLIYYFMSDKDSVKSTFLRLFPTQIRKRTSEIYDTISQKIGGYVIAQLATMASVGVVVTIGLLILKVDYALLLGLITSLFDIVPVAGPAIAFIICMIAVYKFGPLVLVLTAAIFGLAQLVENNFVRPYVFGKMLNLHPLIIFLFLFLAAKYIGIIGVVFAPAIAALFVVLIEEIYMKSLE